MAGDQTALNIALASAPPPADEPEQIDLLDEIGLFKNRKVIELQAQREGKIGRPKGARNRRTVEMANYLLSRYRSPLELFAQIVATPTAELAAALGCTVLEALQEQRLNAIALAPFIHQKQPVAVDLTNKREIHITIVEGLPMEEIPRDEGVGIVDVVAREVTKTLGPPTDE